MGLPVGSLLLAIAAIGYAAFEIWNGYRFSQLSGFSFFFISGLWIGLPFLAVTAILVWLPSKNLDLWQYGLMVVWLAAFPWKGWQERKARQQYPEKWARWIKELDRGRKAYAK